MTRFSVAGRCFKCLKRYVLPDECDLGFNTFREVVSMKSLRLLSIALLACACTASAAIACDAHKSAKGRSAHATTAAAKAAHAACTAEMAANCTPAMKAACESNAAVAAAMGCDAKGATKGGTTAMAAGYTKSARATMATKSAKGGDCCAMKGASTTTAVVAGMHGKAGAAGTDHCAPGKGTSAITAVAGAGMKCAAHASAVAHDCSACDDWTTCEQDVRSLGANAQVVPLKNGAMIVYTSDSPASVKALQSVVAKRHDKMVTALAAGGSSKLCDECKQLRGAIASGKLHREVVNVERGCMTLITSNDPGIVQKIRAMTGQPVAMR